MILGAGMALSPLSKTTTPSTLLHILSHLIPTSSYHHSPSPSPIPTQTPSKPKPSLTRAELEKDPNISTIFHLTLRHTPTNPINPTDATPLTKSLSTLPFLLTNDLIDRVLLRMRFSHSPPLSALLLFLSTSLRRGFYHSPLSLHTTLYILARSRQFPLCFHVLTHTHRRNPTLISPRALHVLLSRVAKLCSLRHVVKTFWSCKRFFTHTPFSTPCFNALLRSVAQEMSMSDARIIYHDLKHRFPPDLHTFNTLLSGWTSPRDAEAFFQEMVELGVAPDVVSYNCLVDCYCKGREVDRAMEMVEKMRAEGVEPDVVTYTSLIGGMGLVGRPDQARGMLKDMREFGCYPDTAAYNAAIRNFCIARRMGDAFQLMEEMKEKAGLQPNATSFNLFFRSLYQANELKGSWELYRRMRKVERCLPNTQTCMFLVRMFKRHEKVDMAVELWEDMVKEGFGSLTLVSDVLIDLLCDEGKVVEAEKCFLQMVNRGHKPSSAAFKRITVLMELAKMHDSIKNLSDKMATFGSRSPQSDRSEDINIDELMGEQGTSGLRIGSDCTKII